MHDETFVKVPNMLEVDLHRLRQDRLEDHAGLNQQVQKEHQNPEDEE
jgi:hypothetical protein